MAWLRANPWLHLRPDGQDHAPSLAAKIEAATGVSRVFVARRWTAGRLHLLQLHAFGPEFAQLTEFAALAELDGEGLSGPA
jgi:hypothetical protein